ncbi:FGGY-family carbohydrate kinase [Microbacterium indicum]|uniref:FGGY-family carbohydrate kinase n=1 Tax=Microbacterium indicum TaxID=358100 RepID=UPI00041188AF|nr:FGGY-family carbohydrate kinase [Microbacterium indicum]
MEQQTAADLIGSGGASLGIELGSTRIKACLIDSAGTVLATGSHDWENALEDGLWTYALGDVHDGLRAAYADLAGAVRAEHGVELTGLAGIGVSAMMHGYLAFDEAGELLVPFRTWRNVSTARAAAELSAALDVNIPLRWSIAHLYEAVLAGEDHVSRVAHVTTLAGYVHELLTGERVLGVGDASGMFPIDPATRDYDAPRAAIADRLLAEAGAAHLTISGAFPAVRTAGEGAGSLTADGAAFLDPTGSLRPGAVAAAPEGDAGTGMVATNAVAPRTGNVSAGTSIFAMVVLERPLVERHEEIDVVTTPTGDLVGMVHCNNGASEIGEWAGVFREFAAAIGSPVSADAAFAALLGGATAAGADDGVYAYNHLSGEPIAGIDDGRPLVVRTPGSSLSLAGLMRAQLRGSFATLALGMRILTAEGVAVDDMYAHGGIFRTEGVAQRLLAEALGAPVTVSETASEGGAWGMALLAAHAHSADGMPLDAWLSDRIFSGSDASRVEPDADAVADHASFLDRWSAGLAAERAAADSITR